MTEDTETTTSLSNTDFWKVWFLAFGIIGNYALSSATIESMFSSVFDKEMFPNAWLCIALGSILMVSLIRHLWQRYSLIHLFMAACFVSSILFAILMALYEQGYRWVVFGLYVWKDLYIVVLVELFWTFANSIFALKKAQKLYGYFLAAGSFGNCLVSFCLAPIIHWTGTNAACWMTMPTLWLLAWAGKSLESLYKEQQATTKDKDSPKEPTATLKQQRIPKSQLWRVVYKSAYLLPLLLIVAIIQIVITAVDLQFRDLAKITYPNEDMRTQIFGMLNGVISGLALLMQLTTSWLISFFGMRAALLCFPVAMIAGIAQFMLMPVFIPVAFMKVISKVFDYSLFRTAKELLYIPLSVTEKTSGKAAIDMITYRTAKGGASLLFIVLTARHATHFINGINISLCLVWLFLTLLIIQRYQKLNIHFE